MVVIFSALARLAIIAIFRISPISTSSTSAKQSFNSIFAATASNVDLVEDAIERRLLVNLIIWR